ncbi:MAG: hypothetical protein KAQ85_09405, partial [Thermodesulfovibrionia bacterium]|nr:hypothetical protein [Thermodesulfovibrionia bacterium]
MRIGVYGSAAENNKPSANEKAREIGREIARKGHVLITGGCNGFPYEAVIGAREFDGHCIAYSPATSLEEHVHTFGFPVDGFSEFVYTPESFEHANDRYICLKYRNLISVASVDAGLIIGGRTGTMNEFTLLYD